MRKTPSAPKASLLAASILLATASTSGHAYNLVNDNGTELNLDVEAVFGLFTSQESYGNPESKPNWQEAAIKYGFSGSKALEENAQVYGALKMVTSGTWGDGDASGATDGKERKTNLETAFVGYRNDNVDLSIGRQGLIIGDGFILNDDALNLGNIAGIDDLDRGGAYWLGGSGRKSFGETAILRVGKEEGIRSDIFWFKSDNKAQGRTEMAGINVEYNNELGTFAGLYLKGLDTSPSGALGGAFDNPQRDGQTTMSVRYQGNAGVENLFLSAEFATQEQGDDSADADAIYVEAGWTFADLAWAPSVNYRYSSFDKGYDQLFTGFNRGYGTWFQGEVWANYAAAGPGNTGVDVQHIAVKAYPAETLALGALFFDFDDTSGAPGRTDAQEINLYAEWVAHDHLIISPLVGFYTPDSAAGPQGNDDTNTYMQVLAIVPF